MRKMKTKILILFILCLSINLFAQTTTTTTTGSPLSKLMNGLKINFASLDTNRDRVFDCRDFAEMDASKKQRIYQGLDLASWKEGQSGRKITFQCDHEGPIWNIYPPKISVFKSDLSSCSDALVNKGFFIISDQPWSQELPSGDKQEILVSQVATTNSYGDNFIYTRNSHDAYLIQNSSPFWSFSLGMSTQGHVSMIGDLTATHTALKAYITHNDLSNTMSIEQKDLKEFSLVGRSLNGCNDLPSSFPIVHVTHQNRTRLTLHELMHDAGLNGYGSNISLANNYFFNFMSKVRNNDSTTKAFVRNNIKFEIVTPFDGNIGVDRVTLSERQSVISTWIPTAATNGLPPYPFIINFGVDFKPDTTYTITIPNAYTYFSKYTVTGTSSNCQPPNVYPVTVGHAGLTCTPTTGTYNSCTSTRTCHQINSGAHSFTFKTAPEEEFYSRSVGDP